jgi:hypothetical protein
MPNLACSVQKRLGDDLIKLEVRHLPLRAERNKQIW